MRKQGLWQFGWSDPLRNKPGINTYSWYNQAASLICGMVDEVLISNNNVFVHLFLHHILIMPVLAYTAANNASSPFKPQTLSAYKTLENRDSTNKPREKRKYICITPLCWSHLCSLQIASAKIISMNQCGGLTQQYERVQRGWERMIMWNLRAGLSLAHTHRRCMPRCHKTSCCQSAEERVDGEETVSGRCLFSTKAAQSDWRPGLPLVTGHRSVIDCTACGNYHWGLRNKAE